MKLTITNIHSIALVSELLGAIFIVYQRQERCFSNKCNHHYLFVDMLMGFLIPHTAIEWIFSRHKVTNHCMHLVMAAYSGTENLVEFKVGVFIKLSYCKYSEVA